MDSSKRVVNGGACALISILALGACGDSGGGGTLSGGTDSSPPAGTTGDTAPPPGTDTTPTTGGTDVSGSASNSESNSASATATATDPGTGPGTDSTGSTSLATDTDETSGLKFDLDPQETSSTTDTGEPVGEGSCRPSEIYGAAGGYPAFSDPAYANFIGKDVIVMTSNAQEDGYVLHVLDISGDPPPPNLNYDAPKYHDPSWQQSNLGRIFGLTLDSYGNIFVAPATVYGPNPSPATIKRIDGKTGVISDFATLPNNGPAMGNLNYDCVSETIYVSNHEDGRIYQLDTAGQIVSTYHHGKKDVTLGAAADPGEPDGQFAPLGQRVWAVQSHAGRLYYSVWAEDGGRPNGAADNEIWSVAFTDNNGVPDPTTAKLEITAPAYQGNFSNPVSDLSFAATGWMLISQRSMYSDNGTTAHQSTTYEYDYNNGVWELKGTTFLVGELVGSAAGGVDHDFKEGGYVWMSGDALDFYTPDCVYGLQGTPHEGGDITNSTLIDLDGEIINQDKTALGDVEVPIPGDVMPVPPPQ